MAELSLSTDGRQSKQHDGMKYSGPLRPSHCTVVVSQLELALKCDGERAAPVPARLGSAAAAAALCRGSVFHC